MHQLINGVTVTVTKTNKLLALVGSPDRLCNLGEAGNPVVLTPNYSLRRPDPIFNCLPFLSTLSTRWPGVG